MEVHQTYLKSLKVTLKTGPNPNPLFIYFYFLKELKWLGLGQPLILFLTCT